MIPYSVVFIFNFSFLFFRQTRCRIARRHLAHSDCFFKSEISLCNRTIGRALEDPREVKNVNDKFSHYFSHYGVSLSHYYLGISTFQ